MNRDDAFTLADEMERQPGVEVVGFRYQHDSVFSIVARRRRDRSLFVVSSHDDWRDRLAEFSAWDEWAKRSRTEGDTTSLEI